jgi:uncharacterized protein (DUF2267 family)
MNVVCGVAQRLPHYAADVASAVLYTMRQLLQVNVAEIVEAAWLL